MKVKMIFYDWRDRETGKTVYQTQRGISLSSGVFHSGTTFDAEIKLDGDDTQELSDLLKLGNDPLFIVSLP